MATRPGETVRRSLRAATARLPDVFAADTRLVVVTCGAVAVDGSDAVPDLMHAGVWGLLRTVQAEHPGRVLLVDVDDWTDLSAAVAHAPAAHGRAHIGWA